MSYSVDTSALMDAWIRYYPPDVFHSLWDSLDQLVSSGRFLVIDEVCRELSKQDDDLHKWVKERPDMIVTLDEEIQLAATPIINDFPSLTNAKSVMGGSADPFVIALAQQRDLIVVMAEKSKPTKPRIPDVCREIGIVCITLVELFRREGWRL